MDKANTIPRERRFSLAQRFGAILPWRLMAWLRQNWPPAFHLLRYGTHNLNSREHWDAAWQRHGKDGFRATGEVPQMRSRVVEMVPRAATVLDVGCGVGETMLILRDTKDCICSGLDIAPSAVAAVIAKGMQAKVAALPELPYPDESFDAVVCTETLEHVTDARAVLKGIRRVLKRGGLLVLTVPDGALDEEDVHVHRFDRNKLRTLVQKEFALQQIEVVPGESPSLLVVARRHPTDLG
jgi:SAM-dependent methyltransferase